jgi:hypothetical protein
VNVKEGAMRMLALAVLLAGCGATSSLEPIDPMAGAEGQHRVRELGAIKGYNNDDPRITLAADGRDVRVRVSTYGGGCHSRGETEVETAGAGALVTPFNYTAPAGTPCTRVLRELVHETTIRFQQPGTVTVRVRGIDGSTRHAGNLAGDVITVERTIVLQ